MQTYETLCIRCGKTRIFKRKWKEVFERGAPIVHVETICPDSECQKIVDADLAVRIAKRLAFADRTNRTKSAKS